MADVTRLEQHPHPMTAVDVALLTVVAGAASDVLAVLVHRRAEGWALPGRFLRLEERLHECALAALRDKVGVTGEQPRQLRVFDHPERDHRYRVLSVAHVDLVPAARLDDALTSAVVLAPVDPQDLRVTLPDGGRSLLFDHDDVVREAVSWARAAYAERPDPLRLLGETFTLSRLRRVHEAVLGPSVGHVDTFRRRMKDLLEPLDERETGGPGRPAQLFRRTEETAPEGVATTAGVDEALARQGTAAPVRELVTRVAHARAVRADRRASYVAVRAAGASAVSLYVHPTRVSLALTPGAAERASRELPAADVQPRSRSTTYVVLDERLLAAEASTCLRWALAAVDGRST